MTKDVNKPLSNTELRLELESIHRTLKSVEEQTKKTNGRVNQHDKLAYIAMGALALLTPWAGWVTVQLLSYQDMITEAEIQEAVSEGINSALDERLVPVE